MLWQLTQILYTEVGGVSVGRQLYKLTSMVSLICGWSFGGDDRGGGDDGGDDNRVDDDGGDDGILIKLIIYRAMHELASYDCTML